MFQIYEKALRYWWSSLPALLVFSAVIAGLEWLLSSSGSKTGIAFTLYGTVLVIWYFHRHFLFHEAPLTALNHPDHKVKRPLWRFMCVSLALLFLPVVPAVLIGLGLSAGPGGSQQLAGTILLLACPLYLAVFSLFATALPASIDRDSRFRLVDGMRQAPRMAAYILAGPVLTFILLATLVGLALWLVPAAGTDATWAGFLVNTIGQTLGFLTSAVAAAVFCHVYRRIVPEEPSSTAPNT